jgi:predicted transcriptional regulator
VITIPTSVLERTDVYGSGKMVLAVLMETPTTTPGAIARRLRINRKTVHHVLKGMRERGLIVSHRKGNRWTHEIL